MEGEQIVLISPPTGRVVSEQLEYSQWRLPGSQGESYTSWHWSISKYYWVHTGLGSEDTNISEVWMLITNTVRLLCRQKWIKMLHELNVTEVTNFCKRNWYKILKEKTPNGSLTVFWDVFMSWAAARLLLSTSKNHHAWLQYLVVLGSLLWEHTAHRSLFGGSSH